MSGQSEKEDDRSLYLEEIHVESDTKTQLRVKLQINGNDIRVKQEEQTPIWRPFHSLELTHVLKITVILKVGRSVAGISFGKQEARVDVSGQEAMETFWGLRTLAIATMFDDQPATVTLKLRPSPTLQATSEHILKLQESIKNFKPLMESLTEQELDVVTKHGIVLAELNPIAKVTFGLVKTTFDVLKEQNRYDAMVSELAMRTGRILPFADRLLEDAVCEETELVALAIGKLCDLIVETAGFACKHIKDSCNKRLLGSPESLEEMNTIKGLQGRLEILQEDLDRAISGEALNVTSTVENDLILKRLKPVDEANYQDDRGCMEGTRVQLIDGVITWATTTSKEDGSMQYSNSDGVMWLYGMPGIGKTALTHSICRRLHETRRLGGSFFCRRDDRARSDTKSVLPTLIYRLSGVFGPYRACVAQALHDDPELTPQSASGQIFLNNLKSLKKYPPHTLVLVVDALDECGDPATRTQLLGRLLEACKRNKWLKTIVTSRPEQDIQSFFDAAGIIGRNLAEDDQSHKDIQIFTYQRMEMVSPDPESWAGERRLSQIINRSGGLFLFVETLGQYLIQYKDPKVPLDRLLEGTSEEPSTELHKLYLAAIDTHIGPEVAEFRLMARTIIGVAPHRALCDEAIAEFTSLEPRRINSWVDDLSSLLYREGPIKGGIRVRHISILEYLTGSFCPLDFRVDIKHANTELSTYCLRTMALGLRFNICGLESSYTPNRDIKNLSERIQANTSDALRYSCLHWSSHLCEDLEPASKEVCEALDNFLREQELHWLEVLSLINEVPAAIVALRKLIACSRKFDKEIVNLAEDVLRFLIAFARPISTSAPHIYLSALPFTPPESSLRRNASKFFPKLMRVSEGQMLRWPTSVGVLKGHSNSVEALAYSPDGNNIVSGGLDWTIRIWDTATGASVSEPLKGHTGPVTSVVYSPDGRQIVSGSWDHTIRIWDATTGAPVGEPLKEHADTVSSVAYSSNGRSIASGDMAGTIRIWNAKTGMPMGEPLKGHTDSVTRVAYSPDDRHIASSSQDYTIRIWEAETGASVGEPLKGHTLWVTSLAYSPDGRNIVSSSYDLTVRIWDAEKGKVIGKPLKGHTQIVTSVAYSPDGRSIVSGSYDHTMRIWDAVTGMPVGEPLKGHSLGVTSVAYSPDSRTIVSSSCDHTVRIWDASKGDAIGKPPKEHSGRITSVACSPDGLNIASGSLDLTIRIWDLKTGALIGEPLKGHTRPITSVSYSPDGRHIVSGAWDYIICIWDTSTGGLVCEPLTGHTDTIASVVYSPDGRYIVSGSHDHTVRVWDAATGKSVGEPLRGHTDQVASVAFSPDGSRVVSGSEDHTIRIWDIVSGALVIEPLKGHTDRVASVAYSPDGSKIVSSSFGDTIRIWDAATGVSADDSLEGNDQGITCVAYSPDGRRIVSGSSDHMVRIWDADTGFLVGEPLNGHTHWVTSVAFSPNGQFVVSGSGDRTIRVWNVEETPINDRTAPSEFLGLPTGILADHSLRSGGPNSVSTVTLDQKSMDSEGWVRCDEGILLWVPEDCRNGVTSPAIITIPTEGPSRRVRLDMNDFKYGSSWTDVYRCTEEM